MTGVYTLCALAVLFVASSAWFAILAYRTDRRENTVYDQQDELLDHLIARKPKSIVTDARGEVTRYRPPASSSASPPPGRRGTRAQHVVSATNAASSPPSPDAVASPSLTRAEGPDGRQS